ncbi:hypothetical protein [Haloplanus pelagicus]|jgi:hypothetical protein|uniref:hypothetical protein n=1 Tax=Haloplanus pelagicus TaxID=2949995 RepID=UPI002041DD06|nr:hypothetical protein [Haloplanus sp. HW8-1]
MTVETQADETGTQRAGNYLRRLVIAGIAIVWTGFWASVTAEIYARRGSLQSGLGETSIIGVVVAMFLIFMLPALFVILRQVRGQSTTV